MVKVVSVPVHRAWAIGLLGQVGVQCLLQRNSALGRSRRRINARLDLAHQRLRPIAGLAQTDPVASVNLYADGADVPPVPAHVPLDGIGLCGGVADHHQPLHLLVAMNTRSHGKLTAEGFRQIQDSHLTLRKVQACAPKTRPHIPAQVDLNVVKTLSCGPRLAFISSDFPLSLRLLISRSLVRIQQGSPLLPQRLCSTPDARTFSVLLGLFSKRELSRMPD